jgi:hypothetical protein
MLSIGRNIGARRDCNARRGAEPIQSKLRRAARDVLWVRSLLKEGNP